MLSTNQLSKIWLTIENGKLNNDHTIQCSNSDAQKQQHLYILSDEEIKDDNWYFAVLHNHVWQALKGFIKSTMTNPKSEYKVIALTDSFLIVDAVFDYTHYNKFIPSPSQSFIDKYVTEYNNGNIITDVMVEYERSVREKKLLDSMINSYSYTNNEIIITPILKVNSKDNTITIKKIKDSWTREEVIELLKSYLYEQSDIDDLRDTSIFNN